MGSWGQSTWDKPPEESGSGSDGKNWFVMPGKTRRLVFLDGKPLCFWKHTLYEKTKQPGDEVFCLKGVAEACGGCDHKFRKFYVGHLSVVSMGDVTFDDKGNITVTGYKKDGKEFNFGKKIIAAKAGSTDHPGTLSDLNRFSQRFRGDLTGTVWDVFRKGKQSPACGDEWTFVERVEPDLTKNVTSDQIYQYLLKKGANPEFLKDANPFDYGKLFVCPTNEQVKAQINAMLGITQPSGGSQAWGTGTGNVPPQIDNDDVPF